MTRRNWPSTKAMGAIALVLSVIGGLLWVNRTRVKVFVLLQLVKLKKKKVKPHRVVHWKRGPDKARKGRPNVVFILLDDVGYNDLSVYGKGLIKTPHIDKLASQGALFMQSYAGNATCAPSRAMLLTGRYPARNRFHFTPTPDGMAEVVYALRKQLGVGPPAGSPPKNRPHRSPPSKRRGSLGPR